MHNSITSSLLHIITTTFLRKCMCIANYIMQSYVPTTYISEDTVAMCILPKVFQGWKSQYRILYIAPKFRGRRTIFADWRFQKFHGNHFRGPKIPFKHQCGILKFRGSMPTAKNAKIMRLENLAI